MFEVLFNFAYYIIPEKTASCVILYIFTPSSPLVRLDPPDHLDQLATEAVKEYLDLT